MSLSTFPIGGRPVPRVGYGMSPLARKTAETEDRAQAVELLRLAYELGIRHFDSTLR